MTMSGDVSGCHWGERSSWHLVGGDQGSCSTPHRAQHAPHLTVLQPQMSVVLRLRNPGISVTDSRLLVAGGLDSVVFLQVGHSHAGL